LVLDVVVNGWMTQLLEQACALQGSAPQPA